MLVFNRVLKIWYLFHYGSISIAFRYFGIAAAVTGLIYFLYEYFYAGGFARYYRKNLPNNTEDNTINTDHDDEKDTIEPFLALRARKGSIIDGKL